jgi:TetR/AcrR family transcriptional regulator, transcriptional repressor of bet genes
MAAPKYRRVTAAARRQSLIEATLQCLRRFGHEGVSVRRIAACAGVSPGLINHHFPSTSRLIAASYEALARSLLDSIQRYAHDSSAEPRERLRRFFQASFAPDLLDPQLFSAWLVFWSLASHSPAVRRVHDRTYGEYRDTLESLLRQLRSSARAPPFRLKAAAIGLAALLDGLWVEASLNARTFRPADAVALCEDWIDALCAGALPRLSSSASAGRRASKRAPRAQSSLPSGSALEPPRKQ